MPGGMQVGQAILVLLSAAEVDTASQAGARLGVSHTTVNRWVESNQIPPFKQIALEIKVCGVPPGTLDQLVDGDLTATDVHEMVTGYRPESHDRVEQIAQEVAALRSEVEAIQALAESRGGSSS